MIKNKITSSASVIHVLSSMWVLLLALIIFIDVMGRALFNHPFLGTSEIVKNSVVAITFLQLPLAINIKAMLRTTVLLDVIGKNWKLILEFFALLLGALFFLGLTYGSWEPLIEAWEIGEYEGEGALRVPTYPVRAIIFLMGIFCSLVYINKIFKLIENSFNKKNRNV
jgi:TRAP-type C4-dicarboxylate transport system permease small subunit